MTCKLNKKNYLRTCDSQRLSIGLAPWCFQCQQNLSGWKIISMTHWLASWHCPAPTHCSTSFNFKNTGSKQRKQFSHHFSDLRLWPFSDHHFCPFSVSFCPCCSHWYFGHRSFSCFPDRSFFLIDNLLTIARQCSIGFALASLVFTLVFLWLLSWLLSLALRVLALPFVACQKFFLKIDDTMTIFHWLHVSFSGLLSFSGRSHTTSSFRINLQALRGEWQSLIWV